VKGIKYNYTSNQSVTPSGPGDPVAGQIYSFYFDQNGTLTAATGIASFDGNAFVAFGYYDGSNWDIFDERHGATMDWATHSYLHLNYGARIGTSGFAGTFTDTTFSIAAGTLYDEDYTHTTGALTQCKVLSKIGGASYFTSSTAQNNPYKTTSSIIQWNNGTSEADVQNNYYVAYWIFVSNDKDTPLYSLMGQREDVNVGDARSNNLYSSLTLPTMFQEMKLLYRVIYRRNGTGVTYVENADYRAVSSTPAGGSFTATDHLSLTNLIAGDSGHTQFGLLAGRSGGQILYGGTGVGEYLTFRSNSNDITTGGVQCDSLLYLKGAGTGRVSFTYPNSSANSALIWPATASPGANYLLGHQSAGQMAWFDPAGLTVATAGALSGGTSAQVYLGGGTGWTAYNTLYVGGVAGGSVGNIYVSNGTIGAWTAASLVTVGNATSATSATYLTSGVDNTTIELSSNNLRVKDAGITLAKMANINQYSLIGRTSAGAGVPQEIASANDGKFLRADLTWQTVSASLPALTTSHIWAGVSNVATDCAVAGDVSVSATGTTATMTVSAKCPTGSVVMYGGASAPSGWVLCDGTSYDRTGGTYDALFAVIGTTFGAADGSHFNVPDFRGVFPKGAGTTNRAAGKDANGNYYAGTNGTYTQDKYQGHYHTVRRNNDNSNAYLAPGGAAGTEVYGGGGFLYTGATAKDNITDGTNGTPRTGLTTEPQSLGITFIIKL
jgi:microcystin-dependent protein